MNKIMMSHITNNLSPSCVFLITAPLFFGCGGPAKEESKNSATPTFVSQAHEAGEKYSIDTNESVLTWEGSMVFGFDEEHIGYIYISKGELIIEEDKLVGGTVEVDMNTMEYKDKLNTNTPIQHLKSPDYFDVAKFPTSTFSITKVVYAVRGNIKVTGNLTIKGVTNSVTFPARIEVKDGRVKANGKLVFDRTLWGIRYASGKFYDNLADQTVSDEVELDIKIVARK